MQTLELSPPVFLCAALEQRCHSAGANMVEKVRGEFPILRMGWAPWEGLKDRTLWCGDTVKNKTKQNHGTQHLTSWAATS